ncbi:putative DEDDh ribonuclease T homologue [Acaryochloris phage A-HIS1]|nr:ribonuclease T [Acaryochloris phage A-HIS1]CBA17732.1 putative DEDDh ribonuclease T homologue [Acaryochloris phage A-HIS1]
MRVLGIDTETGGLDPSKSDVLTVGVALADITSNGISWVAQFSHNVKHDVYRVTPKAMEINGLRIANLENARTLSQIWRQISPNINRNPNIVGHNVYFDIDFLHGIPFESHKKPRNVFDTYAIANVLKAARIPYKKLNLAAVCRYHNIDFDESEAHEALYDAIKSVEVLHAQLSLIKSGYLSTLEVFNGETL